MLQLSIFLEADGMLDKVDPEKIVHVNDVIKIGALNRGMSSGKPSVAFSVTLPDGQVVLAETSMKLFHTAAKAFAARYGWQDADYSVVDGVNRHES